MNKIEYISELKHRLKYLPAEDREDAIAYYEEYLDDLGLTDIDNVSGKLKSPKEAAREIIENCTVKALEEQKSDKSIKGSGKIIWLVILGIASLPVSLPVAIVAVAVAVTILVVAFAVLVAIAATALAVFVGGFVGIGMCFVVPGIATKVVTFGASLLLLGVGALLIIGIFELFVLIIRAIGKAFSKKQNSND